MKLTNTNELCTWLSVNLPGLRSLKLTEECCELAARLTQNKTKSYSANETMKECLDVYITLMSYIMKQSNEDPAFAGFYDVLEKFSEAKLKELVKKYPSTVDV